MWKQLLIGGSLMLSMAATGQNADIVRGEYWIDTDAGFGNEIAFSPALVPGADVMASITVPTSGLTTGFHVLGYRTLDDDGHWSLTNTRTLYVADSSSGFVVRAESFWDVDPGFGMGDPVAGWTPGADVAGMFYTTVPPSLDTGYHRLFLRTLDDRGRWSLTNWSMDTIHVSEMSVGVLPGMATGSEMNVYPNPFAEQFTVQPADDRPMRVILYDPQGKLVVDRVIHSQTVLDLVGNASGIYTAFFWKDRKVIYKVPLIKR
ncbi:MAG: T9SS type A sorting domain-containing protein [Flavobacteriales bacterium]|nr:T9SS type A sorting domain-containing protein [Flavobacteriales bacterium]